MFDHLVVICKVWPLFVCLYKLYKLNSIPTTLRLSTVAPYSFYNNKTWHFGNTLAPDSTLVGETETRCSPHQMTSCGSAGASFSLFSRSPWHSDVKVQTIGGPGGVWAGSLCHWTLPLTLHLLSPKHWARVPAETRQHRDPSCRHWAASVLPICLYKVQSGAWHWSRLAARPSPRVHVRTGRAGGKFLHCKLRGWTCPFCFCLMWEETRAVIQKSLKWFCRRLQSLSPSPLRSHCSPVWILTTHTGQRRRAALRWLLFFAGAASHVPLALFSEKKKNFPHSAGC